MLLAIDIGNTNTVVGVFDKDRLRDHFRVASSVHLTSDEAGLFITGLLDRMQVASDDINRLVISSVVPRLSSVYERMCSRFFKVDPLWVSVDIKLPITIDIDNPRQVGADRIANAAAAYVLFGGPAIVVDFGTAINFDVVTADGVYIGGVLVPGPETSMAELARRAARLFDIRMVEPERAVGRSTKQALESGLFYGTLGQVDFILEKIIEESGFTNPTVIATGGLANGIEKHSRYISRIEPTLTLEGLRIIADSN